MNKDSRCISLTDEEIVHTEVDDIDEAGERIVELVEENTRASAGYDVEDTDQFDRVQTLNVAYVYPESADQELIEEFVQTIVTRTIYGI